MYAKLKNGALIPAPRKIKIGSNIIYNPTDAQLALEGYKPVTYTPMPTVESGFYAEEGWTEQEDSIVQTWTIVEEPADMDIPDEEAFSIIMGID